MKSSSTSPLPPGARQPSNPPAFKRIWEFENAEYNSVKIEDIKGEWPLIPDEDIKTLIASDEQFLRFHRFLSKEIRSKGNLPGWQDKQELSFSLRAGMIRTEIFLLGGIAEAALRAHAGASQIPNLSDKASFGPLIRAWCNYGELHINPILAELNQLKKARDTIHLYVALNDKKVRGETFWRIVVDDENKNAEIGNNVLKFLKNFKNPGVLSQKSVQKKT